MTSLLIGFVGRRLSGLIVGAVALGGFAAGICLAPELVEAPGHAAYRPFFAAAAGLTAAMFIVLALEANYVTSSVSFAVSTVAGLGLSAVAAVIGLLPDLDQVPYEIAFAAVCGGGLAGVISVSILAAGAFVQTRDVREERHLSAAYEELTKPGSDPTSRRSTED